MQYWKKEVRGKIELAKSPNKTTYMLADGTEVNQMEHLGFKGISLAEFERLQIEGYSERYKKLLQDSIDSDPVAFNWNYKDIMDTLPPIEIDGKDLQEVIEKVLPFASFKPSEPVKKGK